MPTRRRARARTNASNSEELALPKRSPDDAQRELAELMADRDKRAAVRAECFYADNMRCRRCSWRWERREPGARQPRPLMLMTDNVSRLAHAHEVDFRSTGGDPHDPRNILIVCWECHPVLQEHREDVLIRDPQRGCRGPVDFEPRASYGTGRSRRPNPRVAAGPVYVENDLGEAVEIGSVGRIDYAEAAREERAAARAVLEALTEDIDPDDPPF